MKGRKELRMKEAAFIHSLSLFFGRTRLLNTK